jgi:hypothetical protein
MVDARSFFKAIRKNPAQYFIIHYSSEMLFDENLEGHSPRITSIVVMHYPTGQTQSFAFHLSADLLNIRKDDVDANLDEIEMNLLSRFYKFARDRRLMHWIHWNMRGQLFGFEHLEHRYRKLTGLDAPNIPVEVRLNLNDILRERYGQDYAPHKQLPNLMLLQGEMPKGFLEGKEESECFSRREFIRMNESTNTKVHFFRHVIDLALRGKLKTAGRSIANRIDRLLESRTSRVLAFTGTILGLLSWIGWLTLLARR